MDSAGGHSQAGALTDAGATQFVMHGARDAIAGGFSHIEHQVRGLEQAVSENPGLAFDLAKAVVESACRTVLAERALAYSELDDLPKLFKNTTRHLPFLPAGTASAEARKGLEKTLSGLSTALQGICELRNECGFASHGAGSPRPHMEGIQALLAAQAADTIVGFLHRVHRQDYAAKQSMRPPYKDNPEFNEHVDETHGMFRVFDVELQPSKVLFEMEPESYRVYLAEFVPEGDGADPATSGQSEVSP